MKSLKYITILIVLAGNLMSIKVSLGDEEFPWIFPESNNISLLLTEAELEKYLSSQKIIWMKCEKEFLVRWTIPRPIDALNEFKVVSLIRKEDGGFSIKTIEFNYVQKNNIWRVGHSEDNTIDEPLALRIYIAAKKLLGNEIFPKKELQRGLGFPVVRWEVANSLEDIKFRYITGDQSSLPIDTKKLDTYNWLNSNLLIASSNHTLSRQIEQKPDSKKD